MILSKKAFLPVALSGLLSLSLTACFHDEAEDDHDEHHHGLIELTLNANQVTDSTKAASTRTATASLTFHEDDGELTGSVMIMGDPITGISVYDGFAGEVGTELFPLEQDPTSAMMWMIPEDSTTLITPAKLGQGGYYLRAELADGNILRSQITPEGIEVAVAELLDASDVRGGFAGVTLNTGTHEVVAYVAIPDLINIATDGVLLETYSAATPAVITDPTITLVVDDNASGQAYKTPSLLADRTLGHESMEDIAAGRWHIIVKNTTNATNADGELTGSLPAVSHH